MPWLKSWVVIVIGVLLLMVKGVVQANPIKDDRWSLASGLTLRYADNVFGLSKTNQDRYKANPQGFPGVESVDDYVWAPSVGIAYRTTALRHPSSLSLNVSGDFYVANSRKSFETLRAGFRQNLVRGTHVSVGYTFIPRFFLGERLVGGTATDAETLQYHQFVLTLDKNFTSFLNGWVEGRYTILDFNTAFDALDTVISRGGFGATYKFNSYFILSSGYLFDIASAKGGNISGIPTDISFIAHTGFVSPTIKISQSVFLQLQYNFQYNQFTTGHSNDQNNFGRKVRSHSVSTSLSYRLTPQISASLSYDRVMKDSNRDFSNYTQNRYILGMTYSLK